MEKAAEICGTNSQKGEGQKMNKNERMLLLQNAESLPGLIADLKANGAEPWMFDWAMRSYLDMQSRKRAVPLKGVFELTPFCNLDCKMCYVHLDAQQLCGQKILRAEAWEKIMSQAIDAGMIYATLTGGECLTHPDFERLYRFLYERSVRIVVLTNAVLLDKQKIEFFRKYPPFAIQATLYGADEEMYERVTGKREFTRVTDNIRNAVEAGLMVNITVTPNIYLTKAENEKVIRCAAQLAGTFRVNSGLITPRSRTQRDVDFSDLSTEDYIDFIKLELSLKGDLPPSECENELPPVGSTSSADVPKGLRCAGGRSTFNVTWEGEMVPCNRLTHINAKPLTDGFVNSWQKIHTGVMEYLLPVECENCAYRFAAKGCAAGHSDAGPGHASPFQCEWCRAMVENGLAKTV